MGLNPENKYNQKRKECVLKIKIKKKVYSQIRDLKKTLHFARE